MLSFFIFKFHVHFVFFAGFACVLRLACSVFLKISRPTFCVIFKPVCNTKLVYSVSLHVPARHHCARVMFIYGLWCKAMLIFHNPRQDSHLDASTRPRTAHLDLVCQASWGIDSLKAHVRWMQICSSNSTSFHRGFAIPGFPHCWWLQTRV